MKDLPPIPGTDYSHVAVESLDQLLEPGFMEALIVAGRTPFEYAYSRDNPRKPLGYNGATGDEEHSQIWHRYVIIPPPGTTRDSRLREFGIGNLYFHNEEDKELLPPQAFDLNAFGTKLFRRRSKEALRAVPVSLGPRGRDTLLNRLVEKLGF